MPGTIHVRHVLRRISEALYDLSPQYEAHPEIDLVDALNDAQSALTTFIPSMCTRVLALKLRPGTHQSIATLAADQYLPADGVVQGRQLIAPYCLMGADGATLGAVVRMGNRKQQDAADPNWHSEAGTVRQVFYDPTVPTEFFVSKGVPASPAVWLKAAIVAEPKRIPNPGDGRYNWTTGTDTTQISVSDECLDPLVFYVVARRNLIESPDASKADAAAYTALFTNWVNAKVTALTGKNPNLKRLPMAPEPLAAAS